MGRAWSSWWAELYKASRERERKRNSATFGGDYSLKAGAEKTEGKTFPETLECTRRHRWKRYAQDVSTAFGTY